MFSLILDEYRPLQWTKWVFVNDGSVLQSKDKLVVSIMKLATSWKPHYTKATIAFNGAQEVGTLIILDKIVQLHFMNHGYMMEFIAKENLELVE